MYVLGELINLQPEIKRAGRRQSVRLPIPWYQRAPLGLLSETTVFVSILTKPPGSDSRVRKDSGLPALGDLVVSVVDPTRHLLKIQLRMHEAAGALNRVFSKVKETFAKYRINIALAETVTTECRQFHDVSLVCELLVYEDRKTTSQILKELRLQLPDVNKNPQIVEQQPLQNIGWLGKGIVKNGWVCDCQWYRAISGTRTRDGKLDEPRFDCTDLDTMRAVVFSDQDLRVARFIFPRPHTQTVIIEHADIPGALEALTSALKETNLNLLTTLLRRGGAMHGNATLISVCEPLPNKVVDEPRDVGDEIRDAIRKIAPQFRASEPIVSGGKHPSSILTLRHPEDRVIQVPRRLRESVRAIRETCPEGWTPVFLSRRFASDSYRSRQIAKIVKDVMKSLQFFPIEARPDPLDEDPTTVQQVESRLWACDLGIVLVVESGLSDESFSGNLAHEYGFLHGQDKRVVFLVQKKLVPEVNRVLSNIQGQVLCSFADGDDAFDSDHPQSVGTKLHEWLSSVKEKRTNDKNNRL